MNHDFMADRLLNYADAMAAFAVVNSLAFLLAITEVEVRCSLAERTSLVYIGVVLQGLIISGAIIACHKTETRLRNSVGSIPADLQSLRITILCIRIAIVLLATVGVIPFVMLALEDSVCLDHIA
jgi:hypothetical protein